MGVAIGQSWHAGIDRYALRSATITDIEGSQPQLRRLHALPSSKSSIEPAVNHRERTLAEYARNPQEAGQRAFHFVRRFFANAMLRSPGGFGGGNGSGGSAGGSSLSRIAFNRRMRGDSRKRLPSIVSRSSSARVALSLSVRSGGVTAI
jgi:hypothetical protein